MNRVSWIILAGLLLACTANEVGAQAEWDFFALGGYTRGNLRGGSENLLGAESKNGFSAGVQAQLRLNDAYGFDVGLRYLRTGGGGIIDSTFAVYNFKDVVRPIGNAVVTLDYVELPATFVFFFDTTESSYLRAYLGLSLNILVRAHATGDVEGEPIDQDLKDSMQSAQGAGLIGAGYVYEFDSWRLIADAYYSQGLTKVTNEPNIKARMFAVTFGVGIPLARD
jgi:opacity protein-like surface antigen